MADKEQIILKNVELQWAFLGHKNDKGDYASDKYQVDVLMSSEQADQIASKISAKQHFKTTEDGRKKITLKSSQAPLVKGPDGLMWTPEKLDTVGNGTTANVMVNIYNSRGQNFAGLGLMKLKVVKEYHPGNSFAALEDDDDSAPFDVLEDD